MKHYDQKGYHGVIPDREPPGNIRGSEVEVTFEQMVSRFMQVALVFNLTVRTKEKLVDPASLQSEDSTIDRLLRLRLRVLTLK